MSVRLIRLEDPIGWRLLGSGCWGEPRAGAPSLWEFVPGEGADTAVAQEEQEALEKFWRTDLGWCWAFRSGLSQATRTHMAQDNGNVLSLEAPSAKSRPQQGPTP